MRGGARPVRGRRTTDWTRALTDAERKAWADGAEEHSTQGFVGHDNLDRMGLVDMGERLYDPQLDQFLSPDPVSQPYSPQGWNPYSYLGNRPLSRVDPDDRLAAVGGAQFVEAPDGEQAFARRGRQFGVTLKLWYGLVRMDSMFMVRVPSVGLRSPKATRMGAGGGSFRHRRRAQPVMAAAVPNLSEPAQPCWSTTKKRDGGTDMRRCLRMCVLAGAASVAGCHLLPSRINDLAASVEGPVGEADLRPIAGDRYSSFAWGRYASARRQLLRVRLSTTKDMVQFASRKNARIIVKWRFCGEPNRRVLLGGWDAYVGGIRVPAHDGPTPTVTDERGRFAYDAVLYARDPRSAEDRWFPALGQYQEAYDLEREPRDVCVRVVFARMLSAYRTTVATIPKEAIAAALGVPADGTNAPVSEQSAGEAPILCVGAYEQAKGRPLPDDVDRAYVVAAGDAAEVWFARNPLGWLRRLGSRPAEGSIGPICRVAVRPAVSVASVRERPAGPSSDEAVLFERSAALSSRVDEELGSYRPGSRRDAEGGSSAVEMLFLREGAGFEFHRKVRWSEAEEIRHANELAWRKKERRELARRANSQD